MSLMGWLKRPRRLALSFEPLWLDRADATSRIAKLPEPWMRKAATDLRSDGVAIVPGHHPKSACDALNAAFRDYVATAPEAAKFRDDHGLHDRLASFHMVSPEARRLANDIGIVTLLEHLFEEEPCVVGSLYFERGSTQSIHRDTPAFFTNPLNHYFGVWTALEDVTATAGPLTYYKGGHRVARDRALLEAKVPEADYFSVVTDACSKAGLECVELEARVGDVVIWHPELPHGGAARRDRTRSRRSIVFHYKPRDVVISGPAEFFSGRKDTPRQDPSSLISIGRLQAINQAEPRFFHNRPDGNFDEID